MLVFPVQRPDPGVSAEPAFPELFPPWGVPPGLLLPVSGALPLLLPRQQCVLSLRIRVSGACLLPELCVWLSPLVWPASCPPQSSSQIGLPACPLTIIRPQPTVVKGIDVVGFIMCRMLMTNLILTNNVGETH